MNKTVFMNTISRKFHKVGFQLKKHSPEILVAAGIIGVTASAIMACKATTKVNFVLEETKKHVDIIHDGVEKGEVKSMVDNEVVTVPYSEEDGKKDLTIVYANTALKFVKLYGPSVLLGVASIGCILASTNILRKRNLALAAAYATVDNSFKQYRERVIDRFGKELDRELKYNLKTQEVEETVVDESGEKKTVKKTVVVADNPCDYSEYARFFDEACPGWDKDPEYNLMYLRHQQNYANDLLRERGYLFLNDVYDILNIPRTRAGQAVGWIYDEEKPEGDNFVDFGIYDINKPKARDFVNGHERSILLDFNVDGVIWNKLP